MNKDLPSPELLRKLLRYEPETGKLFWRHRDISHFKDGKQSAKHNCAAWNARYADNEAFVCVNHAGYLMGAIYGQQIRAHRAIWAIVNGCWPNDQIDHINGDRKDNRIENLRDVCNLENGKNTKLHCTNTSGHSGVTWHSIGKKWQAKVWHCNTSKHLGLFSDKQDAISAVRKKWKELGYHQNHGTR